MTESTAPLGMIQRQLHELDKIYRQAAQDLNTVRGHEQLQAWKKTTTALLAQQVGEKESRQFGMTSPGPSFTNDLLEELSDAMEVYRTFLTTLAGRLKPRS